MIFESYGPNVDYCLSLSHGDPLYPQQNNCMIFLLHRQIDCNRGMAIFQLSKSSDGTKRPIF
jgi:hypothetical protein